MTKLKLFFMGIRPKTLVAAFVPPLVAAGLYYKESQHISSYILFYCLGLAVFIQIATNFYNDAVDFKKGADDKRIGPKRITAEASPKVVFLFGHICLFIACLFGLPLVLKGGLPFLILGLVSAFFAYGYTGGPFPLAYLGLGELFVFLFFGLLATTGSYYLMAEKLTASSIVLGCTIGFLSCALIATNNFRDKDEDIKVKKLTLATRFTSEQYKMLLDLFLFGPYAFLLYFILLVDLKYIGVLLAVKFAHLARKVITDYNDPSELNSALEYSAKHLLCYGVLFIICSL